MPTAIDKFPVVIRNSCLWALWSQTVAQVKEHLLLSQQVMVWHFSRQNLRDKAYLDFEAERSESEHYLQRNRAKGIYVTVGADWRCFALL